MNKKLIILAILTLTLTGCGKTEDKITCTKENEKVIVAFNKDKIETMSTTITEKYSSKEEMEEATKNFDTIKEAYGDNKAFKLTSKKTGLEFQMTLELNFEKLNDEEKEAIEYDYSTQLKMKQSLEKDGYKCN